MYRVYYNNKPGAEPRVIEYGGEEIVWQPKGEVWKRVKVKQKYKDEYFNRSRDVDKTFERWVEKWEKTDQPGEPISAHLLSYSQLREAFKAKNNKDRALILEKDLKDSMSIPDIDEQIKALEALKASKKESKPKRGPGRPSKNA